MFACELQESSAKVAHVQSPSQHATTSSSSTTFAEDSPSTSLIAKSTDTTTVHSEPKADAIVDPRTVPPGTPEQIAKVFAKIPVSVADGPPLGGIGETGIHIDQINLGSTYRKGHCNNESKQFSIAKGQPINVCFRVVHHRIEEEVTVLWEKGGDVVQRRRGVKIPAQHSYRTRAYLVPRREYVADWTVRIFSADNVELASATFSISE